LLVKGSWENRTRERTKEGHYRKNRTKEKTRRVRGGGQTQGVTRLENSCKRALSQRRRFNGVSRNKREKELLPVRQSTTPAASEERKGTQVVCYWSQGTRKHYMLPIPLAATEMQGKEAK